MKLELSPYELEQVYKVRDIMIKDLKANVTIADLSREVRMDEKRLKAGFKLEFGKGIITFLRHFKMEKAQEMLREDKPLRIIANTIGYKFLPSFVRAFHKEIGETPVNWKKKQWRKTKDEGFTR